MVKGSTPMTNEVAVAAHRIPDEARRKAQAQVEAINVDGILDELAAIGSRLPKPGRRHVVYAMAHLERLRERLIEEAERG